MARPVKNGLDYFPLQTDVSDSSSELAPVMGTYGSVGIGTYICVLCDVYKNGYYIKIPYMNLYVNMLAQKLLCDRALVEGSIDLLGKLGILTFFREGEETVITSRGVQKRYLEIAKVRRRDGDGFLESVHGKYWLLSDEETLGKMNRTRGTKEQNLNEPENGDNGYYGNNTVKTRIKTVKTGFYGENPSADGINTVKSTQSKYIFPFLSSNENDKSIDLSDNGYSNNDNGKKGKEEDEFEKEIEREKRESEVREKLGLNPKLSRASKDDPAVEVKTKFDVEGYRRFSRRWGISLTDTQNYSGAIYEVEWDELTKKIEQSKFLREKLSWALILNNYTKIMAGQYDDYKREETSGEKLNRVLEQIKNEEAADGDTG